MRIRSLILTLLLAAPFAAAGNLECNRETPLEYVPTTYRCVYHNGSLAQAYAAMRTNRFEDGRLRLDFPGMPRRLPANNFQYRGNVRFDPRSPVPTQRLRCRNYQRTGSGTLNRPPNQPAPL